MKAALLATLVLAASIYLVGCSSPPPPPVQFSQVDTGSNQDIQVGQVITIVLNAVPSSGLTWAIDGTLPQQLKQQGDPVFSSTTLQAGAGGTSTWIFKAVSKGDTILKLKYWDPSKPKASPDTTFTLGMKIK